MTRLVAILIVIALLWMAWRSSKSAFLSSPTGRQLSALLRVFQGVSRAGAAAPRHGPSAPAARSGSTKLVSCSVCATHVLEERCHKVVPGPEPVFYCSEACVLEAPSKRA